MTSTQRLVLGLLSVVVAVVGAAAAYIWWQSESDDRDYPTAVRDNFLASCAATGAADDKCACFLEEVEAQFPLNEYSAMEQQILSGNTPRSLTRLVAESDC